MTKHDQGHVFLKIYRLSRNNRSTKKAACACRIPVHIALLVTKCSNRVVRDALVHASITQYKHKLLHA